MYAVDSGAVAQDGRIEPGDMILEVNGFSFENMSNDDAVKTLREAVEKPGWVPTDILDFYFQNRSYAIELSKYF